MKKVFLIIGLSVLLCCLVLVTIWGLPDLLPRTVRENQINPTDLLVTLDDFPQGWQVEGMLETEPVNSDLHWGEDNKALHFKPMENQGFAYHFVFKFRNEIDAKYGWSRIKEQGFFPPLKEDSLNGWVYESPIAKDWLFGCNNSHCKVLARYDEFISAFATSINPEYMTREDLEIILEAIDEKMSKSLNIKSK
jgi:hypothetical protein